MAVFLAFAFAYFFSALLRAITATLSPTLTQEFALHSRDLGLLAGGYFLGFALTQLPLGTWLDRHGPKRVILGFLAVAVAGCLLFSLATSSRLLLAARVLVRRRRQRLPDGAADRLSPLVRSRRVQLRANSWMLMTARSAWSPPRCRCNGWCRWWAGGRCSGGWRRLVAAVDGC